MLMSQARQYQHYIHYCFGLFLLAIKISMLQCQVERTIFAIILTFSNDIDIKRLTQFSIQYRLAALSNLAVAVCKHLL